MQTAHLVTAVSDIHCSLKTQDNRCPPRWSFREAVKRYRARNNLSAPSPGSRIENRDSTRPCVEQDEGAASEDYLCYFADYGGRPLQLRGPVGHPLTSTPSTSVFSYDQSDNSRAGVTHRKWIYSHGICLQAQVTLIMPHRHPQS